MATGKELFSVLFATVYVLIQLCVSLQNQPEYKSNQYISYYESHHYHFDFFNLNTSKNYNKQILIENLNIFIHSLLNIEINNKYHLNYFNDTDWNEIITINHQKEEMDHRRLLDTNDRYHLSPVSMTWDEGNSYCLQHYGSMASIMSKMENEAAMKVCPWHCWLGLKEEKGQQLIYNKWSNGRIIRYKNWAPGEPNNDYRNGADCGEIYAEWFGFWNDIPCTHRRFVLCEHGRGQLFGNYIAVQAPKTWQDAEEFCQIHYGTHLATIEGFWDNEQVKRGCTKIGQDGYSNECWIGLKGPFKKWVDGIYSAGYDKYNNWYHKQAGSDVNRWRLILRLKNVADGYFNKDFRRAPVENSDNIEANTYSIIGLISPDEYKNPIDNKWQFKLVYENENGGSSTIIWKQSSWLDSRDISGFEKIEVPGESCATCCYAFRGLGLSDATTHSFLDGNGPGPCWWNSVGTMKPHYSGIPGFNHQIAKSSALYIYKPQGLTDSCANINSNGKWYDSYCSERKHFVCNAMGFSERLSPMLRKGLESNAYLKHFKQWTDQRQLEHFQETLKKQKEAYEDRMNDPYSHQKKIENEQNKNKQKEEWESLREKLRTKGIFDPYIQNGYFREPNLNVKYGNDMRYSFPVKFEGHRRLIHNYNNMDHYHYQYNKCRQIQQYNICLGFDGIDITKYLNQTININDMYSKIKMNHKMKNNQTHCFTKYLCLTINDPIIMIEMKMMNFSSLNIDFRNDNEWNEIIIKYNESESLEKCVYIESMRICIEFIFDTINNIYSYEASVII